MFEVSSLPTHETVESIQKPLKALMRLSRQYFSKPFIYTLVVSAIVIVISLTYGASQGSEVEIEVANRALTEVETLAREATWFSIFINNVSLTLLTFAPLIGAVWMIYIQFNTGWYLGAIAKAYNANYVIATTAVLTSIVGLIEYSAYITALAESVFMVYSATRGEFKKRLIQQSWLSITIVVLLLFIGGVVEAFLLETL